APVGEAIPQVAPPSIQRSRRQELLRREASTAKETGCYSSRLCGRGKGLSAKQTVTSYPTLGVEHGAPSRGACPDRAPPRAAGLQAAPAGWGGAPGDRPAPGVRRGRRWGRLRRARPAGRRQKAV